MAEPKTEAAVAAATAHGPTGKFEVRYDELSGLLAQSGLAARSNQFPTGTLDFSASGVPFARGFKEETLRDGVGRTYSARRDVNDPKVQTSFYYGFFGATALKERKHEAAFYLLVENVEGNPMAKFVDPIYFGPDNRCMNAGRYLCGGDRAALDAYRAMKHKRKSSHAARLEPVVLAGTAADAGSMEITAPKEEMATR